MSIHTKTGHCFPETKRSLFLQEQLHGVLTINADYFCEQTDEPFIKSSLHLLFHHMQRNVGREGLVPDPVDGQIAVNVTNCA